MSLSYCTSAVVDAISNKNNFFTMASVMEGGNSVVIIPTKNFSFVAVDHDIETDIVEVEVYDSKLKLVSTSSIIWGGNDSTVSNVIKAVLNASGGLDNLVTENEFYNSRDLAVPASFLFSLFNS